MNARARPTSFRLLPPTLVLALLTVILVLYWLAPEPALLRGRWRLLGGPVGLLGILLAVIASRQFKRLSTNIRTFDDPAKLVVDGCYRFSRNPMYLGFALLLLGASLVTGGVYALTAPLAFVATSQWLYIPSEERAMARVFGDDYRAYRRRVRRWL